MICEHPHITNIQVSEINLGEFSSRRLVVDTDLSMPSSGLLEENKELLKLHNYLENMAFSDSKDFDEVEIRTA